MKTISFTTSVSERIENAIRKSMKTYLSRLDNGFYEMGLEDTFKMHIGSIISAELELNTICPNERFIVMFEKNMPINNNNDYVDIVIKYQSSTTVELYPIELKACISLVAPLLIRLVISFSNPSSIIASTL